MRILIKGCLLLPLPSEVTHFKKIIISVPPFPNGCRDVLFISVAPAASSIMEPYTQSLSILYGTHMGTHRRMRIRTRTR